jgi:hypothetical protein
MDHFTKGKKTNCTTNRGRREEARAGPTSKLPKRSKRRRKTGRSKIQILWLGAWLHLRNLASNASVSIRK